MEKEMSISNPVVETTVEKELDNEVSLIEQRAKEVVISNGAEYEAACELTRTVKQMQDKVVQYWEPLRVSAYKTYNDVLGHKKEMLSPLESAEKILKEKIGEYVTKQERMSEEQTSIMRRNARKEIDNKLLEADEAEKKGDIDAYEYAMAEAEVMETVATAGAVQVKAPKVKGVSKSKSWEITAVNKDEVPVEFNGIELRPVNEKLVMNLIKTSKGTIKIPGITYKETAVISIKR